MQLVRALVRASVPEEGPAVSDQRTDDDLDQVAQPVVAVGSTAEREPT